MGVGNSTLNIRQNYKSSKVNSKISASSYNDSVYSSHNNVSIVGGKGNDTISLSSSSKNNLVNYGNGDGNDQIYGFDSNDILNITSGTIKSDKKSGSNRILTIGSGNITLVGVGNSTLNIRQNYKSSKANSKITASSYNDSIYNGNYSRVTMVAGDGNDTVFDNRGDYVSISGGNGNDSIYVYDGDRSTIDAGKGNDRIYNSGGDYNRILGGTGNDSIRNYNSVNVTINAGDGTDTIRNDSSNYSSIVGGKGNDLISLSANSKNVTIGYSNGDGNDQVYNFGADDVFNITSNTSYSTKRSGSNLIITIGSGKVTLYGSSSSQKFNVRRTSSSKRVLDAETSYYYEGDSIESDNSTLWGNVEDSANFSIAPADENVTIDNYNSTDVVDIAQNSFDDISQRFSRDGIAISTNDNSSLNLINDSNLTLAGAVQQKNPF